MKRLTLVCAALFMSMTVSAADNSSYKIEVIVFESLDPANLQAEVWPENPGVPATDKALELSRLPPPAPPPAPAKPATVPAPAAQTTPPATALDAAQPPAPAAQPEEAINPPTQSATAGWRWLKKEELKLSNARKRLGASSRYRVLLHTGWIQPLDSSDRGIPVHLYNGMERTEASATSPPPAKIVDGTLTVSRGRYLHVDEDLIYNKTYTPPGGPEAVTRAMRVTQSRRLRSEELHYLDHPLVGLLVQITPVQEEVAAAR